MKVAGDAGKRRMRIVQITPGAGPMYCGNCLRDNALVARLRAMGHDVLMVPVYLPLTLDEPDESASIPIFFGGISVYLDQKSPWFRRAPGWLHGLLAARPLLKWAGGRAAKTRPGDVGELALSMLRGELGNQARELSDLVQWLRTQPRPDVVCLSNALLLGMARQLKRELGCPIVCYLQGEDSFLDGLPDSHREECWAALRERAAGVARFIAPSRYFADLMSRRLSLPSDRIFVVHNGIDLKGYEGERPAGADAQGPVLGYFARMCKEKGLDTVVDAYLLLRRRPGNPPFKLRVGGSCGPSDELVVAELRARLERAGVVSDVEFCRNLSREEKIKFLKTLSVFSVPARYGEAFGLYLLEAWASGIPAVQPRAASFTELVEATGGGLLCAPEDPQALADGLQQLLFDPDRARTSGDAAREAVRKHFSAEAMAARTLEVLGGLRE